MNDSARRMFSWASRQATSICNNDIFIRFFMENGYRIFTMLRTSLYLYFQREISAVVKRHLPFHQAFRGRILMDAKRVFA